MTAKRKESPVGGSVLEKRHARWGYLFTAPWAIGFLLLFVVPFIRAVVFSVSEITLTNEGSTGYELVSVGLAKYRALFMTHPSYRQTLVEGLGDMVISMPLIVMFSLFAAVLIDRKFPGRTLVRAIFFLPVILGTGVTALLQNATWTDAILTGTKEAAGAGGAMRGSDLLAGYLTQIAGAFRLDLIDAVVQMAGSVRQVIENAGVQTVIFLAGLKSIPASMYEAGRIEGATAWEQFWKITFPMISPIILVNIVYTVVDSFTNSGNTMMQLIEDTAFSSSADLSLSTAMAMVYFIAIAVLLSLVCGLWLRAMRSLR